MDSTVKMKEVNLSADFEEIGQGSENLGKFKSYLFCMQNHQMWMKANKLIFIILWNLEVKGEVCRLCSWWNQQEIRLILLEINLIARYSKTNYIKSWLMFRIFRIKFSGSQNSTTEKFALNEKRISDMNQSLKSVQKTYKSFHGMKPLIKW